MANSPQLPFFAQNSTVKAWCHTAVVNPNIVPPTTNRWDNQNFIDGYNLRLDPSNLISGGIDALGKALKFSFITPMQDTKYKIFIQPMYALWTIRIPVYAHALNSTQFPKLTTSFWIRLGTPKQADGAANLNVNQVRAVTFDFNSTCQIRVVVL
jgi:hypothetical protein